MRSKVKYAVSLLLFAAVVWSGPLWQVATTADSVLVVGTSPRNVIPEYDAENHIGLVADNNNPTVATANTTKLNAALEACWLGGSFTFADGTTGPLLKPIRFAGKEFFFNGTIKTNKRVGCGTLIGTGGRGYPITREHLGIYGTQGGSVTRITRLDGDVVTGGKVAVIRVRGNGFTIEGIEVRGRPYQGDSTGEGPIPAGTRTPVGIEIEGRAAPATGGHYIHNCTIADCTYGICCKGGYYADDNGDFVVDVNHADNSEVQGTLFHDCYSCFRSESIQAVIWKFTHISVGGYGGAGLHQTVVCDAADGGNYYWDDVSINHPRVVLFKLTGYSPHSAEVVCTNFKWDAFAASQNNYFTLFQWAGTVYAGDNSWIKWKIRCTGHLAMPDTDYDADRILDIPDGSASVATIGIARENLLFDVMNLPTDKFTELGDGPWWYPQETE